MFARLLRSRHGSLRVATAVVFAALCLVASTGSASTADLAVSNSDSPDPVTAGSNITYTQSVTNNGPDSASSTSFVTAIPAYSTYNALSLSVPAGWTCISPAGGGTGSITCTASSLSNGSTANFSFTVKVSSTAPAGYLITNTATASSSTPDWNTANNAVTVSTAVTTSEVADVATTVSMPTTVIAGNNFTIAEVVKNNGGAAATGVSVAIPIPSNTTFAGTMIPPAGWTCITPASGGTGTVTCSPMSLSSGSSATLNVPVTVSSSATAGTSISETVSVTAVNDPNTTNNSATATTVVVASSSTDFAVTTTMGPTRVAGTGTLRFTNVVTNNGPSSGNATFSESTPTNTTFSSLTTPSGWTCTTPSAGGTGSMSCSTSSAMSPGASSTFNGVLTVGSSVTSGTSIALTGSVTASSTDSVSSNNSASATSIVDPSADADVALTISHSPDPVTVNQQFTYRIAVTNNGPATATNVGISDTLPSAVTYQTSDYNSSNVTCSYSSSTTKLTCTVSSLAAGAVETILVYVKASSSGIVTNTVSVSASDQTDALSSNNSASTTITIDPDVDLTITKSNDVSGSTVTGASWTWTVHVANGGASPATFSSGQRIVLDNLPNSNVTYGGVSVVNESGISGTISASISSNDLTAKASGGSVTIASAGSFDLQFTATTNVAATYANPRSSGIAIVDPDGDVIESSEGNNTASDSVTVAPGSDLTLTNSNNVSGSVVLPNGWTWTLHVANSGVSAASFSNGQTILSDNLPNSSIAYGTPSAANSSGITGTVSCSISSGNLTCTASGAVSIASSGAFDVQFTATPSAAGTFSNPRSGGSAKVDPNNVITESSETNNTATDSVTVTAPDLSATLSDNVSTSTTLGSNWTWSLQVANSGSSSATFSAGQIIASANLPDSNITYGTPSVGSVSGITGTVSCSISSSNLSCTAGGSVTLATSSSFTVTFTATPLALGSFACPRSGGTASVDPSGVVTEANETNNAFSDTVTVTAPDLTAAIANNVSGATTLGNSWTWTITLANSGSSPATFTNGQTIFSDSLPDANVSYGAIAVGTITNITNSGNLSCSISSSNLTCAASGGPVTFGSATGSYAFSFMATPSTIGTFANPRSGGSASVDPSHFITESNESNNSASDTVTVTAPDLTLTKSNNVSAATTLGNSWTWTLHVANSGNAAASFSSGQTIVLDNLPNTGVTYGTPAAANASGVTGTVTCSISTADLTCMANGSVSIASSGSFDVQLTATPSATGTFANPRSGGKAMVDPSNVVAESSEGNNNANDSVTVTAPDLTATIANSVAGTTTLGNSWTWTLHVANSGNAAANFSAGQTIALDNLPNSGLAYGTPVVANAIGTAGTVTCAISSNDLTCSASGSVAIASSGSFDVQFTVTPSATGTFANPRSGGSASVDPSNAVTESNEGNNIASDSVTVSAPDLSAAIANDVSGATTLGNSWTWTVTLANSGSSPAVFANGQTIFSDSLPNGNVSYGAIAAGTITNVTNSGIISCSVSSSTLTCAANGGSVTFGSTTGSYSFSFAATPSTIGTFANPRSGGSASVDPSNVVTESNESNNGAFDSVTVSGPDLSATGTNDVSGATTLGSSWTWTIRVWNSGSTANFASGQTLLADTLPNADISYGTPAVVNATGLSGAIACAISGTSDLTCSANGAVALAGSSSFEVTFTATPTAIGTFASPRSGGTASVDPSGVVPESNEANNAFSDSVTVTAPDLTATMSDSVAGATTLGNSFTLSIAVANTGNAPATFASGQTILSDSLASGAIAYGPPSVANRTNVSGSGSIVCAVAAGDLTCIASGGTVVLGATTGTFRVDVAATPSAVGTFGNPRSGGSASVDPSNVVPESNESNNGASDSVVVTAPQLTLTMSDNASGATMLGRSWSWTLHVANSGGAPASFASGQTIVLDNLPNSSLGFGAVSVANAVSVSGTIAASIASSDLTATASGPVVIAAGGSFDLVFISTPSAIGTYANPRSGGTAAVDPGNVIVESDETDNSASGSVVVTAPDLTVTISDDVSGSIVLGNSWTWTMHIANSGNAAASFSSGQTVLADALPSATYGTPSIANSSGLTGAVACTIDVANTLACSASGAVSLAAGGSFDVRVIVTPSAGGTFTNPRSGGRASVDPLNVIVESSETNNSASDTVTVHAGADLSLAITGPAAAVSGDPAGFDYTLTVTNNGPQPNSGGFAATDVLPSALTFQQGASSAGCSAIGQTVTCSTASGLAVGSSQTFTIHVTVASAATVSVVNSGSVASSGTADPVAGNDVSSSVTTSLQLVTDYSVSTNVPASAIAGTRLTCTVSVTNVGPSDDAAGFTLTDTLPAATTFVPAASDPACAAGAVVTCSAAGLSSGASRSFTIVAAVSPTAAEGSVVQNRATVASNGGSDPNTANDASTGTTTIAAQADLGVTLTAPVVAGGGSSITYTLTVTNAGPSEARSVIVTAVLPSGLTLFSQSMVGGIPFTLSNSGNTMTATSTSFPPGASSTIQLFAVAGNSAGTPVASATVAATTTDPAMANNAASAATDVVAAAPAIAGLSPLSGPTVGGQTLTITGANLDGANSASIGGTPAAILLKTSAAITVTTPQHAAGTVDVVVTTAGGSATATAAYTYVAGPVINDVSPASGPQSGGTSVTITGAGFGSGAAVTFGTVAAAVTSLSPTAITVKSPAGSPGSVDVVVRTTDGQIAIATRAFTYLAPPRITGISPSVGTSAGGNVVTITGGDFMSGAAVTFGTTASPNVVVVSATNLTATAPPHVPGVVDVTVRNPDGQSVIVPAAFTVILSGDVNGDGQVNAADVFALISSLFAHGAAPLGNADVNGDGIVSAADVFYLVNYLFAGGPPPR